jgi:hypothetical protein
VHHPGGDIPGGDRSGSLQSEARVSLDREKRSAVPVAGFGSPARAKPTNGAARVAIGHHILGGSSDRAWAYEKLDAIVKTSTRGHV